MTGEGPSGFESRALALVMRCLDLDEDGRGALIEAECGSEPQLAVRVRTLLAMEDQAPDLLSTRMIGVRHPQADPVPERVGKYRVTDLIGRGGMGMVVRAERDDGVYSQVVAIKLIGANLRSEADRERFANERRLLARLSHPGIARILDGGDEAGRPWLVMELVEGGPVTNDLRQRVAGLDETLDVFASIAEAVSHAHRNLVIHGDIKPSNVLRAADGSVKLLDFGIGRLAEAEAEGEAYPLTPAYSAPERRAGAAPLVAGDVYSLAVLLHEMVTGQLPEDGKPHMQPAERIGRLPASEDFVAILAKGLEAEPEQRYPDVAALLGDLERYRQTRPVSARAAGSAHAARLFARRNRFSLAIAGAFVLLLTTATIVSLSLYFDARRQRAAAEARFDELRSLAGFQLFDLYDSLAGTPGTTAARARLAAEAQRYLDRLGQARDAPDDLKLDIARGLDRLAEVLGVPRVPNLGQPERARANLARAAAILDGLAAAWPNDPAIARERARNLVHRAQIATWLDFRTDLARPLIEQAAPLAAGSDPESRAVEALRRSAALDRLGWDEDYPALRDAAAATLAWLDGWPGSGRPMHWHLARADALNGRGDALYYLGDRGGALASYRAAEAAMALAGGRWPRRAAILARQTMSAYNVLSARSEAEDPAALVPASLELVSRGESLIALEPNDVALVRRHLTAREFAAQILDGAGRRDEALIQQQRVVDERARLARLAAGEAREARDLAFSQSVLGTLNWNARRRADACRWWTASAEGFQRLTDAGRLNAFDRDRNLPFVRFNLDICAGRRPDSAFRPPA